ncbi:MAG: hypothetical protein GY941_16380, partial [Planctomycetes bacterium]|nr:hypothetical protein [Planctomycetota bacterium]
FFAVSERDIHYCIHEIWENLSAEEIADEIVRLKTVNSWNLSYGEIDPLSKGDDKYMKNRDAEAKDSFTIIEERLLREGIALGVANKDKKSGISNLKSWMKGPNKIPIIYFLDTLRSAKDGAYGIIHELKRLCYDDGDVEKKNDHFVECCYRHTISGVKYVKKVDYYPVSAQRAMGARGWMR